MAEEAEELNKTNWLTIVGFCAASVVFLFMTFHTNSDAARENAEQNKSIDEVNHKVDLLHDDLTEFRKEMHDNMNVLLDRHRRQHEPQ